MVKFAGTLNHFQPITALVIGDYMLDTYTTGRVKRISPEAPVPVMEVLQQASRPGGAGNVVLNLTALGAKVISVGRIGRDAGGEELKKNLSKEGVDLDALVIEKNYRTPVKNRLIAGSQQLLRLDSETIAPISSQLAQKVLEKLRRTLPTVQVMAVSDYGKGFLTPELIEGAIRLARGMKIPVIVDPKGLDFGKYKGASIVKPNLSEAYAAAKVAPDAPLSLVARRLFEMCDADWLLITKSEAGISLFDRNLQQTDFPARAREVKDTTGAGDTVLAVVSAAIANGLNIESATELSNIAAGIAIERLGCAQVTISELAHRLLEYDTDTKIFEGSHPFALRQVFKDRCYSLLVLPKGQKMSNALFRTLHALSEESPELIVYVQDARPDDEFVHFLSSLQEVDYIILHSESLQVLCESIRPEKIYFLENEKLQNLESAKALLSALKKTTRSCA